MSLEALNKEQLTQALMKLENWQLSSANGCDCLSTHFKLGSFTQAMDMANKVFEIAETQNHHPKLVVEWGSLEVHYWTHTSNGVTELDIAAAIAINGLQI